MNRDIVDEPSTHPSLLDRARLGDDEGWHTLVQVYGPIVYRWIRRCGVQSADAADVMQDTFLSVAKALPKFDLDRSGATFRGWLWTIARNKLRDRQRADQRSPISLDDADLRWSEQDDAHPPSELADDVQSIQKRLLQVLRHSTDPKTWQMFLRTAVEGCDPAIVAKEMCVSRWTVYKARARVLQRLRKELEEFSC
ncbi:RNA polymerase sigma factor [Crateriforma conspicua]|uniref:RNA polymerase sigma factor CnrH n=1 Tax=Crateriforma conspicua TaxID=2527996 RepID=A0A5C5XXL0_9PLAN|nr:sigma-70 family RNA polymerase sigma factor [Crateriforma conspicua]TWT68156.1 RNA polymerase sigma factor CnrH [Crateriforma conspicua]